MRGYGPLVGQSLVGQVGDPYEPPIDTSDLTDTDSYPATPTNSLCHVQLAGIARRTLTRADVGIYLGGTLATGVTWAEIGVGIGMPVYAFNEGATFAVTPLGWVTAEAAMTADANTAKFVTVTGFVVPRGTPWWLLMSINATQMPSLRARLGLDYHGKRGSRANQRISTAIGTPLAFTTPPYYGLPSFFSSVLAR